MKQHPGTTLHFTCASINVVELITNSTETDWVGVVVGIQNTSISIITIYVVTVRWWCDV